MIFAFPYGVLQTFIRMHLEFPFVTLSGLRTGNPQTTPGAVKLRESSGRAGGFPIGLNDCDNDGDLDVLMMALNEPPWAFIGADKEPHNSDFELRISGFLRPSDFGLRISS
jgi:hypothetical protein